MKKYIISSPKFTGEIQVLYGLDMKLLLIDFIESDLSEIQIQYFNRKLPVLIGEPGIKFLGGALGGDLTIIEAGFEVTFDEFWEKYNRKINKERCIKVWNKLSKADQASAFFKLYKYQKHLSQNTWKSKADPETYLKNKYWNNDWK